MRIAICDDENDFIINLKSKLYEYSNKYNWESVIDTYINGYDLINAKIKYDIIILDYQMNKINGLETAKHIRKGINQFSCIIFLTSYPEIAIPAYNVDTYRFVVKNTLYKGLYEALDDFRMIKSFDYDIIIKSKNELITVNTKDIIYLEAQNKDIFLYLIDNNIIHTKATLNSLYNKLPHTHFFKIHKAFIINFKYIHKRNNTSITMQNQINELPISRNYLSKFKETYYNYLKNQ